MIFEFYHIHTERSIIRLKTDNRPTVRTGTLSNEVFRLTYPTRSRELQAIAAYIIHLLREIHFNSLGTRKLCIPYPQCIEVFRLHSTAEHTCDILNDVKLFIQRDERTSKTNCGMLCSWYTFNVV